MQIVVAVVGDGKLTRHTLRSDDRRGDRVGMDDVCEFADVVPPGTNLLTFVGNTAQNVSVLEQVDGDGETPQ